MHRSVRSVLLSLLIIASAMPMASADPLADAGATVGICDAIDPSACMLPWPNDAFTRADSSTDTGRRLDLSVAAMPRNAAGVPIDPSDYNRNDGFSPGAMIVTKVPGMDTPEAFAATDPVTLRDLSRYEEPDAPIAVIDAETGVRHPIWSEIDLAEDLDGNPASAADTTLIIRPARNFLEGRRYVVVLRNLRDATGAILAPQPAFDALARGSGPPDRQSDFDARIAPVLEGAGFQREDLYLAWDFTVASGRNLSERMLSIRDAAFAELGDTDLGDLIVQGSSPKIIVDSVTQQLPCRVSTGIPPGASCIQGNLDARILRRVEGRIIVPCYLNAPGCPTGSRFAYATPFDTVPIRIPGNTMAAPFTCNIPAEAANGARFKPSLYGHGLFGSGSQVNSGKLYDLAEFGLMFCGTDFIGMASEDIGTAVSLLAELGRFSTLPDRGQQGMLNFLFLGRAMIHPDGFSANPAFQVDGRSVIDTERLYYNGGSQGGIIGGSLTAVAPDFTEGHLGVPGMNYSTLLRRSVDFDIFAEVLYRAYPNELERPLILSLIQTLWDRAESNGYAQHMTSDPYPNTPAHRVLLTPAFGDHQVTNWATDVMARTVGAVMRDQPVDAGRHPAGDRQYWGIPRIEQYPYRGDAVMVVGEIGPLRQVGGRTKGTTPPPLENRPNRAGVDSHGPDWSETADGYLAIGSWLSPDPRLPAVCGAGPCYLDGWTGP